MADWLKSMQQTFEYYIVDPGTWKDVRRLDTVKSSTISWDLTAETLGSATFDIVEPLGECYIRVYMITIQNGVKERHPLGTFLIQTPTMSFNGKVQEVSMDAYTPLLEIKENPPPIGYALLEGDNIMEAAYRISREQARAPVVSTRSDAKLFTDFVANTNDTWLSFLYDLIAEAKYTFSLDELGRILFAPKQDIASLQPVWTYDDSNSSILYSDLTLKQDLYGVPNVVEVVYSKNGMNYQSRVVNDDPDSPTSTVKRGREIIHRVVDPELGNPTENQIDEYAMQLLKDVSSIEYTLTYTHGYCPVRIGDCVRFNYARAGLNGIKAQVINQSIKCKTGSDVTETAVFNAKLWR